jgi:hypothetical protein
MNCLPPKHDCFKRTTLRILSETEKREIVDSVHRSTTYFSSQLSDDRFQSSSPEDYSEELRRLIKNAEVLKRYVSLVKGAGQSRYLYRPSRRREIEREAKRIANETGAEYEDVVLSFMYRMSSFVSDDS